ncbi:MAG: TIM44-like domain-containing protein [Bacilli bacterium]
MIYLFVAIGIFAITILVMFILNNNKHLKKDLLYYKSTPLVVTVNNQLSTLEEYQKIDINFDASYFLFMTNCLLKEVQTAWSHIQLSELSKLVSTNLYEQYLSTLTDFETKGQKNIITDILPLSSKLCSLSFINGTTKAEILLQVSCLDYLVTNSSHRIITGSDKNRLAITYLIQLERTSIPLKHSQAVCSNCKQVIKVDNLIKCPFCNCELVPTQYDYIMTEKKVLAEYLLK